MKWGTNVMQKDNKNEEVLNLSNTADKTTEEIKNRSIRWSDSVYDETRAAAQSSGKSLEEFQKELLGMRARISLESDHEFGSQINVVNELLNQLGDRFTSIVTHANSKIQIQATNYEKLKQRTESTINELKDKNDELGKSISELEKEKKKLEDEASTTRVDKWRAEEALEKQQHDYDERIKELKDSIEEKNSKIADKNDKIDRLEKDIESMRKAISLNDELKSTVESLQLELESQAANHQRTLDDLKKDHEIAFKNRELEIQTALQNEFRQTLEEKLEEYDQKREKLRAELRNQYEQELQKERQKVLDLQQEIRLLKEKKK